MARHRTFNELDEMVENIEHARCVHPLRTLKAHHFYLDGWISSEGGLAVAMFNALLFVPFMMYFFFDPVRALIGAGIVVVASALVYESCVIWRRRHPRPAGSPQAGHDQRSRFLYGGRGVTSDQVPTGDGRRALRAFTAVSVQKSLTMGTFYDRFNANMELLGVPAPRTLFESAARAQVSIAALSNAVLKYGPRVTVREVVLTMPTWASASALSELATLAGGMLAALYVGACIGSLLVATNQTVSLANLSMTADRYRLRAAMPMFAAQMARMQR